MVQRVRQKATKKSTKRKIIKKRKEKIEVGSSLVVDTSALNPFKIADPQSVIYGIKNIYSSESDRGSYENPLFTPRPPEKVNYWRKIAETIRSENDILQNELGTYKGNFFKEFLNRGDHSEIEKDNPDPMDKSYLEYLEIEKSRFELYLDDEDIEPIEENKTQNNPIESKNTEIFFENSRDVYEETPNILSEESLGDDKYDEKIMQITTYG